MEKTGLSKHWHELRYHMIARLIWYLVGLVTWAGVRDTFGFLYSHLGKTTAVLVDAAAILLIYGVGAYLWRLWNGARSLSGKLRKVQFYRADSDTAVYKYKMRIVVKNETNKTVHIRSIFWVANDGQVAFELPPKLKMQIEKKKDGYLQSLWNDDEYEELDVPSGFTFQTWVGLREKLSNEQFGKLQSAEQFGVLSLIVDGYRSEAQIPA